MLSGDGGDLSELSSVRFEDAMELDKVEEVCFLRTSLQSLVIPESVRNIRKLTFGFCQNLDLLDFGRGSQLQETGKAAFRCCPLKLIGIHGSVEVPEKFGFTKSSLEVTTFESGSALKTEGNNSAFTRFHRIIFAFQGKLTSLGNLQSIRLN
jgi:hypothetical protein